MAFFREACCASMEAVRAAAPSGARRIELCEKLELGGVTPSPAFLQEALQATSLPIHVLIRPRGGDFVYTAEEVEEMERDIRRCQEAGAAGVVIGALDREGNVDVVVMQRLMAAAKELSVTFHRAFDETADPLQALETIIGLGCHRILTSGHAPDAFQGRFFIGTLVEKAAGRIGILAGCGVRPGNIAAIDAVAHAPEYHSSWLSTPWEL